MGNDSPAPLALPMAFRFAGGHRLLLHVAWGAGKKCE